MQLFSNNFKTTLAAAVDNVATSITVASSVGLPTLGAGDTVLVTLESANRLVVEIVEVTAVVGNVLTVVRGREGTVASSFELGSFVEGRLTAGWLNQTGAKLDTIESGKQNTITGAASSVVTSNLNPNVVVTTDASGKLTHATAISTTELSYLDGVSSNIQTQLGGKQATITGAATTITSSNLTASMAMVTDASGKVASHGTVSATELGYLDGVTSNIQTQLNSKQGTIGFTPVQQGGGTLQGTNKMYFGWGSDGSQLRLQVDSTDFGNTLPCSITKNAATATKLTTARTISLAGDVTGSVSFDGSDNVTITATVADDSHNHIIANVDGLQTALDSKIPLTQKGVANGVATLDATGLIPSTQLPSYIDDVLEFTSLANFPVTGESGKIYVALDTNKTYRWSGSAYTYITSGAVDSVAGKIGVVTLTKSDVGLANVDNTADSTKVVASAGKLTTARTISLSGDVTGSTSFDGSTNATITVTVADDSHNHVISNVDGLQTALDSKAASSHIHANATTSTDGFMSSADKTKLDGVAAGANNYAHPTGDGNLHVPATGTTNAGKVLTAGATAGSLSWVSLPAAPVTSVAGKTGVVTLVKADVGLGDVDNTSDANKPVSTATQTALNAKQNTITGAATTVTTSNLTASMAMVTDASGKIAAHGTVSATELGYLDGVTSNIQTQLNSKEPTITTLPVSKGGTGVGTLTGLVKGNGTGAMTAAVAGTDYVVPSGSITGNASTASALKTERTIAISGDYNGSASFNGSANITIALSNTTVEW